MCGGAVLLTSSEVTDRPVDSLNDFCQVLMARLMEGTSICGRFKEACLRAILNSKNKRGRRANDEDPNEAVLGAGLESWMNHKTKQKGWRRCTTLN